MHFATALPQEDPFAECTEPNPAVWALRPDYEKLRNGDDDTGSSKPKAHLVQTPSHSSCYKEGARRVGAAALCATRQVAYRGEEHGCVCGADGYG